MNYGLTFSPFVPWPVFIALVVAAFAFVVIRDTPESAGLPPIDQYRNDPPKVATDATGEAGMGYWQIILKHVVFNRVMVMLALANVFVYALRYGVLSWTPTYLSEYHHASVAAGIAVLTWGLLAAITYALAQRGQKGPFERAMRHLVAVTERQRS